MAPAPDGHATDAEEPRGRGIAAESHAEHKIVLAAGDRRSKRDEVTEPERDDITHLNALVRSARKNRSARPPLYHNSVCARNVADARPWWAQ